MLRVGLVGAGMISRHHLIAWARLQDAEVVAICDPDIERAQTRAAEFGIGRVYGRLDAMLAEGGLDALDIASPRQHHAEAILAAAENSLACLCQKPLAPTHDEARDLVEGVAGRIRLMVHENWRFRPYYRQISHWLAEGRIGRPVMARMAYLSSGFLPDAQGRLSALERQPFLRDEPRLIVAETLIHHLDVLRWLLGPLQLRASILTCNVPDMAGETTAAILLETTSRRPVLLSGSFVCGGFPLGGEDDFELIGETDTIELAGAVLSLRGSGEARRYDMVQAYQESFDAAIAHFGQCLATGSAFETDAGDNLEILALVDEAYRRAGIALAR